MNLRHVHVIGGGPAGLFAATLLRRRMPTVAVTVHERSLPDDTFGFGVAFTRRTLDLLSDADEAVVTAVREGSIPMPAQEMRVGRESVFNVGNDGGITIARAALLTALSAQARTVGVTVDVGSRVALDDVRGEADLIIAADGVASAARTQLADRVGARVEQGRGLFMWLGCDRRLESNLFAPMRTGDGLFNIHCYPYSESRSTIGVETDVATWQRAGMDKWTATTSTGDSDTRSISYLQEVFGAVLGGATLLGNRSRWARFRTVTAARWSDGNTVLIGDAAHTAHYSVGSGTKMAMEDAVSLVDAVTAPQHRCLRAALDAYEDERRPRVEKLQRLADRSRWWWESLERRLHLPPQVLMLSYLSRGGAVSARKIAETDQRLLKSALVAAGLPGDADDPQTLGTQLLHDPVTVHGQRFPTRILDHAVGDLTVRALNADVHDPGGVDAENLVSRASALARSGADVVVLTGPGHREAVLDRLAVAENVRRRGVAAIAVETPPDCRDDVVDGIIAGRIDLVRFTAAQTNRGPEE